MLICSVVDGRIPAAASHIGPRKGQYMRFQRSIRSIGRLSYTAMGRDESDFRLPPISGGQDESAGFPGYNARDILESFTGEKHSPS